MIKTSLAMLLMMGLAVIGGAASLSYVLDNPRGAGAVTIGPWTAFPKIGAADADPYSKARAAREGLLALGSGEGVAFTAARDSDGAPLRIECNYRVEGATPPARFWTLYADGGQPGQNGANRLPALNSQNVLRRPDSNFTITVSRDSAAGNWIALSGSGPMALVLTVYDSTITTGTDLTQAAMPYIVSLGCDA